MKRVVIILISILFVGLGIFCTYYTISLENERKEEQELKNTIEKDYDEFRTALEDFSNERTKVYKALEEINYLENIPDLYENIIKTFKSYEGKLDKIVSTGEKLKDNLLEKDFKNKDLANKKEAYITNYEQTNNYFVSDVKKFNSQIEIYNKMVEADTSGSFKKLELFESKYKDLIDVNKDGIYSGIDPE